MPDILLQALDLEGLKWLVLAAFLAGLVRGFAGFGTAMIYLTMAAQFLDPVFAIVTLLVLDSLGPLPAIPRALREADWPDLRILCGAMILALPVGLMLLLNVPAEVFRYAVSLVSLVMLALLLFGFRYSGRLSRNKTFGVGAAGGVLGGAVGLPGPPIILFYMASPHPSHVIRATTMLYLFCFDLAFLVVVGLQGMITSQTLVLGLLLVPASLLGTLLGTWLFRPGYETVYRAAAFIIIAASAIRGLPIWG